MMGEEEGCGGHRPARVDQLMCSEGLLLRAPFVLPGGLAPSSVPWLVDLKCDQFVQN